VHVEDNHNDHEHGDFVKAEGTVTAVMEAGAMGGADGSITIDGEHGGVMFVIPACFGATGAMVGDEVEAKGTAATTCETPPFCGSKAGTTIADLATSTTTTTTMARRRIRRRQQRPGSVAMTTRLGQ
jgi:hypothetical protein